VARRWEWAEQVKLASLLDRWLPADAVWTATDPVARSAVSGMVRRLRGVKRGVPDCMVWCRHTRPVVVELKSPGGKCSPAQREVREQTLAAGVVWWEARSANAAMVALAGSGVKFRKIINADGSVQSWKRPRLADWEKPRRDPSEPRPQHPAVLAQRRKAQRRWRARQRAAREAASLAEREGAEQPATHDAYRVNFGA
jgi:hypothetical protein